MSTAALTATGGTCRSCFKLFTSHLSGFRRCAFSTSVTRCKDEDEIKALEQNPYFSKYSQKFSELQKTTPDELNRRIAAVLQKKPQDLSQGRPRDASYSSSPYVKRSRSLDDIVTVELLVHKSAKEISDIWLKHHSSVKDTFSVVISSDVYDLILQTSSKHPTFLLPLPRDNGYEYFVTQSCGHEFHLTPLVNYQAFQENAPECLALYHFTDFSEKKGVVLMRGEYNNEVLDLPEAMCLTNQLHRYYGHLDRKRMGLLERFTNAPSEFRHMDLIVELERMVT